MQILNNGNSYFPFTASSAGTSLRKFAARVFVAAAVLFSGLAAPFFSSPASAEDAASLNEKLEATKVGAIESPDFASYLLAEAETGELTPPFVHRAFSEISDLPHLIARLLPERVSAALAKGTTAQARGLLMLAEGLENSEPGVSIKTKRLFELADKADKLLEEGKTAELLELDESIHQSAEKGIVASRLAKVSTVAQQDLESEQNPFEALRRLVALEKIFPREKLAATIEKLVQNIEPALDAEKADMSSWSLDDGDVLGLVRLAVQARPEMRPVLAKIYERRLLQLMETNTLAGLSETYSALLENRPDPSEANDALRMKIILDAKTDEMKQFASGRLEELRYSGRLTKSAQLKLLLNGYYGTNVLWFFAGSIGLILIFALLMFIRPRFIKKVSAVIEKSAESRRTSDTATIKRPPPPQQGPMTPEAVARAKEEARRRFEKEREEEERDKKRIFKRKKKEKYVPGYMRDPDAQDDEYTRLMTFFGLEDTATEGEIKKAYRERVKNLHPDAKPGEVNTQDQDFIELKEMYDRLLEVRKSWFGKR